MADPKTLQYTAEHEWVLVDGAVATVGITAYAAEKLGEAAREAAAQLAREGREQWGVRATFKPKKNPPGQP